MRLPDCNGIEVVTYIALDSTCGLIVVSALTSQANRIVELEFGADDYVAKPLILRALVSQIPAVNHRVKQQSTPRTKATI
jgi:DNA-binding response OmpR family regulator